VTNPTDKAIRERAKWAMRRIVNCGHWGLLVEIGDPDTRHLITMAARVLDSFIDSEDWTRGDDPAETLLEYAEDDLRKIEE